MSLFFILCGWIPSGQTLYFSWLEHKSPGKLRSVSASPWETKIKKKKGQIEIGNEVAKKEMANYWRRNSKSIWGKKEKEIRAEIFCEHLQMSREILANPGKYRFLNIPLVKSRGERCNTKHKVVLTLVNCLYRIFWRQPWLPKTKQMKQMIKQNNSMHGETYCNVNMVGFGK